MERAESLIVPAGPPQLDEFGDDIDDIKPGSDFFDWVHSAFACSAYTGLTLVARSNSGLWRLLALVKWARFWTRKAIVFPIHSDTNWISTNLDR